MTPIPVTDESMPDVIANEPDTSEIPVLPNYVCAPVRNPRVRWRSDVLEHPTPQTALLVVSSQNAPAATSGSSPMPVTHETPPAQPPVTPHNDVQPEIPPPASSTDDHPCHFHTMMIHHHGSIKNKKHRGSQPQDTPVIIAQQVPSPPI